MELTEVFDENEKVIDTVPKEQIIKKQLRHRGSMIFIFNSKGKVFMQKRAAQKLLWPNLYDIGAGGSCAVGEEPLQCAIRETQEEIGAKDPKPEFLFRSTYEGDELKVIGYVYQWTYDGPMTFQKEEVAEGDFYSIEEVDNAVKEGKVCPDVAKYWKEYIKITSPQ